MLAEVTKINITLEKLHMQHLYYIMIFLLIAESISLWIIDHCEYKQRSKKESKPMSYVRPSDKNLNVRGTKLIYVVFRGGLIFYMGVQASEDLWFEEHRLIVIFYFINFLSGISVWCLCVGIVVC